MVGGLNAIDPDGSFIDGTTYHYPFFGYFKGVLVRAAIAHLNAVSGELSKKVLVTEGIVSPLIVEVTPEAVVVEDYRPRIDAAIALLQGWLRHPPYYMPRSLDQLFHSRPGLRVAGTEAINAALLAESPITLEKLTQPVPPEVLMKFNLDGIYFYCQLGYCYSTMDYVRADAVGRILPKLKPYCVWNDAFMADVINIFQSVGPGGKVEAY
ncbi:hypothetical protein FB451DRAFT_1228165 [Mycena latifolia]|nr:hypothetical protein FB451DRAFT_1228165 [Mycena latifolia]